MKDKGADDGGLRINDSIGSRAMEKELERIIAQDTTLLNITQSAHIGIDLGSGSGDSALALFKTCPNLRILHCVDHWNILVSPFKEALSAVLQEHRTTMQDFMKTMAASRKQVDVVMIASVQDLTQFRTVDLVNLARIVKPGGVIFEFAPNYSFKDQVPMEDFFHPLAFNNGVNIWQRNE